MADDRSLPNRRSTTEVAGVVLAVVAVGLTTTAVGVAAPDVADDLGLGVGDLAWVYNVYLVFAAAFALLGGRLGDRFGRRTVLGVGAVVFAAGAFVCALSAGHGVLLVGRAVQGLGAALVLPASIEVIAASQSGPGERRSLLVRGTAFAAAFAIGPLVGGLVTDTMGWRWIFVIVGVLALVAALLDAVGSEAHEETGEPFGDWRGAALAAGAVFLLVLLAEQSRWWGAPVMSVVVVVVAAAVLVAFGMVERGASDPLLRWSILRNRVLVGGDLATFASALGMLGLLYFFGLFARSAAVFDASALQVARSLIPFTVSLAVLGVVAGGWSLTFGRALPVVTWHAPDGRRLPGPGPHDRGRQHRGRPDRRPGRLRHRRRPGQRVRHRPGGPVGSELRLGEAAGLASLARFAGTALAVAIGTATYLTSVRAREPQLAGADAPAVEIVAGTGVPGRRARHRRRRLRTGPVRSRRWSAGPVPRCRRARHGRGLHAAMRATGIAPARGRRGQWLAAAGRPSAPPELEGRAVAGAGERQRHGPRRAGRRIGAAHQLEHPATEAAPGAPGGRDARLDRPAEGPELARRSRARPPSVSRAGGHLPRRNGHRLTVVLEGDRRQQVGPHDAVSLEAWRSQSVSWRCHPASTRAWSPEAKTTRTSARSSTAPSVAGVSSAATSTGSSSPARTQEQGERMHAEVEERAATPGGGARTSPRSAGATAPAPRRSRVDPCPRTRATACRTTGAKARFSAYSTSLLRLLRRRARRRRRGWWPGLLDQRRGTGVQGGQCVRHVEGGWRGDHHRVGASGQIGVRAGLGPSWVARAPGAGPCCATPPRSRACRRRRPPGHG